MLADARNCCHHSVIEPRKAWGGGCLKHSLTLQERATCREMRMGGRLVECKHWRKTTI